MKGCLSALAACVAFGFLQGCGSPDSDSFDDFFIPNPTDLTLEKFPDGPIPSRPVTIEFDGRQSTDSIRSLPLRRYFKETVATIIYNLYHLEWYTTRLGTVSANDTVQIIYISGRNSGYCSGYFLSDDYIISAAHCNSDFGWHDGDSCRNDLIFAYRRFPNSPIIFYECQKVIHQEQTRTGSGDFQDITVFQIAAPRFPSPARSPFQRAISNFSRYLNDRSFDTFLKKYPYAISLVVDPPSGSRGFTGDVVERNSHHSDSMAGYYDLVIGTLAKTNDGHILFFSDSRYPAEKGNSGAPVFAFDSLSNALDSNSWIYLGPLASVAPDYRINALTVAVQFFQKPSTFFPQLTRWLRLSERCPHI